MIPVLRYCPQCGSPIDPDKKFCTNCGASLQPDLPQDNIPEPGSPPIQHTPAAPAGKSLPLIAGAGIVLILIALIAVFIGYPAITGNSLLSGTVTADTPQPKSAQTGNSGGSSYVVVETENPTLIPTTMILTQTTTIIPTTIIPATTARPEKPVICPSDKLKCNNTCIDSMTDSKNCGYCGNECEAGLACVYGQCILSCGTGLTSCPEGCFNLKTDGNHCGSCLNNCPAGLICRDGICSGPDTPMIVPR